jgi:TolA-binding protein
MSPRPILPVLIISVLAAAQARPFTDGPERQERPPSTNIDVEKERIAQGLYESAVNQLNMKSYEQAKADLETIITRYGDSSVCDDALLQLATYLFESGDFDGAERWAKVLVDNHFRKGAVPGGHLLRGRIALAKARTPEAFLNAIASYGKVKVMFPGNNEAVPEALYRMAEAYRLSGRVDESLRTYGQVCSDYSQSLWCARATLGLAVSLVQTGHWSRAIEKLQWVRTSFPDTPEAGRAYQWNTMLFRLYVRPSLKQEAFTLSPRQFPGARMIKDVKAMAIDASGRTLLAGKGGVGVLNETGTVRQAFGSNDCVGVFLDHRGGAFALQPGRVIFEQGQSSASLEITKDAKIKVLDQVPAAGVFSTGEFLVADNAAGTIEIFDPVGAAGATGMSPKKFTLQHRKPPFSLGVTAIRLAVNDRDDVAVLERDSKANTVLRRSDGTQVSRMPSTLQGFELRNPVDIAFDPLGHLYVLYRDSGRMVVFSPFAKIGTPVAVLSIPEKTGGAFLRARAFAIDPLGRLFIFDDRAGVQTYQ